MRHLRIILLPSLILALATLACGLGGTGTADQGARTPASQAGATLPAGNTPVAPVPATPAPEPPPAPPTQAAPQAAPTAPAEVTEALAEAAQGDAEEAALDLNSSMTGLENLNSYRAAFRFDWNGTKAGQPVTGYMQMRSAFVREPAAQELHFEGQGLAAGQDQGLSQVAFVQVGNTAWFYESESDTWMQVPAGNLDFAQGLFFKPEDLVGNFDVSQGRRSSLPQEVNGVPCYQYTFNEQDFDRADLPEGDQVIRAQGQVCVAVEGNYVVSLAIDADLRYADPSQVFEEGNMQMTFEISDVNQPLTIEPPAEAQGQTAGRQDIPMLPDAQVELSSPGLVSYGTASSVADAARFYQAEMPKQDWIAAEGNKVLDSNAVLNYNKGSETANIVIGSDESGTKVWISISRE
jgi:hypothetical protein